jgi:hypothetical protein
MGQSKAKIGFSTKKKNLSAKKNEFKVYTFRSNREPPVVTVYFNFY